MLTLFTRVTFVAEAVLNKNVSLGSYLYNYSAINCTKYWDCTAQKLIRKWSERNGNMISRQSLSAVDPIKVLGHTPIWLRVQSGKLYCVKHPNLKRKQLRMKIYRALHYINRVNRILKNSPDAIPNGTEWWSHHSDWNKISDGSGYPPIFSVSGSDGYADVAGVPFMSFSDKISERENFYFAKVVSISHREQWKIRKNSAFFRGSLSDCAFAVSKHYGDIKFCARAKTIFEAVKSKRPILQGLSTTSAFEKVGLNVKCDECRKNELGGTSFIQNLFKYKYLINFPGAGNWSRRLSLLLRSGGTIFQMEGQGYQFYDFNLVPGLHYIPFNPELGKLGAGNLVSRLTWAEENDFDAEEIGSRSASFGMNCLTESSIDYFVTTLLRKYSKLLFGPSVNFEVIDLSTCLASSRQESIAKLCKAVIERCWD